MIQKAKERECSGGFSFFEKRTKSGPVGSFGWNLSLISPPPQGVTSRKQMLLLDCTGSLRTGVGKLQLFSLQSTHSQEKETDLAFVATAVAKTIMIKCLSFPSHVAKDSLWAAA